MRYVCGFFFFIYILGDIYDEVGVIDLVVNGFGWSSLVTNKDSLIEIYFVFDVRFV